MSDCKYSYAAVLSVLALQEDYGYTNHITMYNYSFGISAHNLIMCAYPKVIRSYVVHITTVQNTEDSYHCTCILLCASPYVHLHLMHISCPLLSMPPVRSVSTYVYVYLHAHVTFM